jgi:hypothetical protein
MVGRREWSGDIRTKYKSSPLNNKPYSKKLINSKLTRQCRKWKLNVSVREQRRRSTI